VLGCGLVGRAKCGVRGQVLRWLVEGSNGRLGGRGGDGHGGMGTPILPPCSVIVEGDHHQVGAQILAGSFQAT